MTAATNEDLERNTQMLRESERAINDCSAALTIAFAKLHQATTELEALDLKLSRIDEAPK